MSNLPGSDDVVNESYGTNLGLSFGSSWILPRTLRRVGYGDLQGSPYMLVDLERGYVSSLEEELVLAAFPVLPARKPARATLAVQVVLRAVLRAVVASRACGEPVLVRYFRHPSSYTTCGKEYAQPQGVEVSYTMVLAVVEMFTRLGWVEDVSYQRKPYSLLRVNVEAIPADLVGYHVSIPSQRLLRVRVLVDGNKVEVPVSPPFHAQAAARFKDLTEINVVTQQHTYGVVSDRVLHPLDKSEALFHTVYNSADLEQGGRLYCGIQNLPSKEVYVRQALLIDGEPTVELDYGNLHIRMLYAERGVDYQGDCYDVEIDLPGWAVPPDIKRKLLKLFLLILPNCGSVGKDAKANRKVALASCQLQYRKWLHANGVDLYGDADHPYRTPGNSIIPVLDAIMAAHQPIADSFYSGKGIFLQATDAKIACDVMLAMARAGKVCLGVHDSFIVKEEDEKLLHQLMIASYIRHIRAAPVVDAKEKRPGTYDHDKVAEVISVHTLQTRAAEEKKRRKLAKAQANATR